MVGFGVIEQTNVCLKTKEEKCSRELEDFTPLLSRKKFMTILNVKEHIYLTSPASCLS